VLVVIKECFPSTRSIAARHVTRAWVNKVESGASAVDSGPGGRGVTNKKGRYNMIVNLIESKSIWRNASLDPKYKGMNIQSNEVKLF